ncbi:PREDICTED: THAP domain-containing protein 1-like [Trachymyrmex cornetzi]|uniref:THAP domain-containing protein 1-like n=1 Tax=Trachymyrmex cornetzi TaxID=471704 RepID=UPI00084EEC11|nr:PREDICTED: THAP domain-containing protein 1-like [Trachymyrmex cornetzi]
MPVCCIKHCTSRTSHNKTKNVKFFRFPKEAIIRQQWLKASQRTELDIKPYTAICSNHFDTDCFTMVWTKPRSKNVLAREMQRLKKDSIPTKMLILEKKRRILESKENMKRNKERNVPIRTGVPTYTELIGYIQEKHRLQAHKEIVQHVKAETAKNVQNINIVNNINNIKKVNYIIEETVQHKDLINDTTNIEILGKVNNHDVLIRNGSMKTLLMQVRKLEEEKLEVLKEKEILEQQNEQLSMEVIKLHAGITQLRTEIIKITIDRKKQANAIPIEVLKKIFTPGQIAKLMSTNNRIRWSSEDIESAIYLRSLSPKAYKYLRNVKKMPLPSANTLQNWIGNNNLKNEINDTSQQKALS